MTAQKGKDLLIKILSGDNNGVKTYRTAMGLRANTIALNAAAVDISDASQTHGWRELLSGAGLKTMSINGEGVFRDDAADEKIRTSFVNGSAEEWQVHIPNFYDITGKFQITSLEYAGEYDGVLTWRLSLESAGSLSWAASTN